MHGLYCLHAYMDGTEVRTAINICKLEDTHKVRSKCGQVYIKQEVASSFSFICVFVRKNMRFYSRRYAFSFSFFLRLRFYAFFLRFRSLFAFSFFPRLRSLKYASLFLSKNYVHLAVVSSAAQISRAISFLFYAQKIFAGQIALKS